MMNLIADQLFEIAQQIASRTPNFQECIGPGKEAGNGVTTAFLRSVDTAVADNWPTQVRLQEPAAPGVKYSFDYFIPAESTAVEIALSLRNFVTEFEKDIFKAILANEADKGITKLILIGKAGSVKRQNGTGPNAIKRWVQQNCGIKIEVRELL
jgi:hypothetical protein